MGNILRTTIALLATGSVLLCGGMSGTVKSGVQIDGVAIGGFPYAQAEALVRGQYAPVTLTVETEEGNFTYAVERRDNLSSLVRKAKRGQSLASETSGEWVGAEEEIAALCKKCARESVDARVFFTKAGEFFYTPERAGRCCCYEESLAAALKAVHEGKERVKLRTRRVRPEITVQTLKERTQKLASFVTYFDGENIARSHNITLACTRISGTVLPAGGTFSFNEVVGKRTEENGFQVASVIFDGQFVPGVGGGVCQVSTTLMNCAVRAGLNITCSRPHSLSVSYVPPSCDAMVSDYSDLCFENPYDYPVYIAAQTGKSYVRFTIYGLPDGKRYVLESNVLLRIAPPVDQIVEGDEEKCVRQSKEGIASESYLAVYEGETLLKRTLFRRDTYAVVQGIRQIRKAEEGEPLPREPAESVPDN